jgi:beta-phosphoglucomutase-like phosphatase (HAD superfamily)
VLFDFDGTLTQPGDLDFETIRMAVDCPAGVGLLEYLDGIADPSERRRKEAVLEDAEAAAAGKGRLNRGALELVALLRRHRVPMAVITRNRLASVEQTMASLAGIDKSDFLRVVTRDMGWAPSRSLTACCIC